MQHTVTAGMVCDLSNRQRASGIHQRMMQSAFLPEPRWQQAGKLERAQHDEMCARKSTELYIMLRNCVPKWYRTNTPRGPSVRPRKGGTSKQCKVVPTTAEQPSTSAHIKAMPCPKGVTTRQFAAQTIQSSRGRQRPKCPRLGLGQRSPPPDGTLAARVRRAGYNALNPLPSPASPPGGAKNGKNQRSGSANPQATRRKGGWVPGTPCRPVHRCRRTPKEPIQPR